MRTVLFAMLAVVALASAAPALAADDLKPRQISVWCSVDDRSAHDDLQGLVVIGDGSHGQLTLRLLGSVKHRGERDTTWQATGEVVHLNVVRGQNTYTFKFDISPASTRFQSYRIAGPDDVMSRIVDRDECGFRVPEAPASSLLILAGGLPAVAWLGIRRLGIRLPAPSRLIRH